MPFGEARGAIISSVQFQEVFALVIIVQATEEASGSPTIACVGDDLVTRSHAGIRIGGGIKPSYAGTKVLVLVVFLLIATQD